MSDVLQQVAIHDNWTEKFRGPENERFYSLVLDDVIRHFARPGHVLDAGCGSGVKTYLLWRFKGVRTLGVDYSDEMLSRARLRFQQAGMSVEFEKADLTQLPYPDGSFTDVLVWGVLMHIPDVERALSELVRVLAPGGTLAIEENNGNGLQPWAELTLRRIIGQDIRYVPSGIEHWEETPGGPFVTRYADPTWMIEACDRLGATLITRRAGELTMLYTRVPKALRPWVHRVNRLWYRFVRWPGPAIGNLFMFKKRERIPA